MLERLRTHLYNQAVRYRIYTALLVVSAYLLAQGHIDASLHELVLALGALVLGVESVNRVTTPKDKP